MTTPPKKFAKPASAMKPLVQGLGACLATDRIMVDGEPIGYAMRDDPQGPHDSGWQFFAGDEDEEYLEDADRLGLYDCNTVANYDPAIIAILGSPVGSEYVKNPETGKFEEVED